MANMAQGTIKFVDMEKGYGFIHQDGTDPNDRAASVHLRISDLRGGTAHKGARIEFEVEQGPKGPRARNPRLLDGAGAGSAAGPGAQRWAERPAERQAERPPQRQPQVQPQPQDRPQPRPQEGAPDRTQPGGFLNPYNFVRTLEQPRPAGAVLGSCPPPPHDRSVGLTGRITCELEAVTPLFVSDSHAVVRPNEHASYRFFQLGGRPALPATSLRGMIRSVYEAVTNSCFGVMDDKRLSQHLPSRQAPAMVPARVEQTPAGWQLRLLPGASPLQTPSTMPQKPTDPQYAGWLAAYWPIQPSKTLQGISPRLRGGMSLSKSHLALRAAFISRTPKLAAAIAKRNPDKIGHGEAAFALLRRTRHPSPNIGEFWDVVEIRRERTALPTAAGAGERICAGWLCVTNENIENKHSERFFFRAEDNIGSNRGAEYVPLPDAVRTAYGALIADYQDRHAKTLAKRPHPERRDGVKPALSRFIYRREERELADGALVYAMLDGRPDAPQVRFIVPVSVPRILYDRSPHDLLADHLKHCTDYDALCPACRLFGWVYAPAPGEDLPPNKVTALAGRLRLTHGTLEGEAPRLPATPLAILSSPKPTTTVFYLLEAPGKPARSTATTYDTRGARLRGRKVYRHQGASADWSAEQAAEHVGLAPTDQNRTVLDALQPGARFTFDLDFANLAPFELGALLWSLELEAGMHHRLGFAKPLGFGSVRVGVKTLALVDPAARYGGLDPAGGWREVPRAGGEGWPWVAQFKAAMAAQYGGANGDFAHLPPIADLHVLLAAPEVRRIHYPRATRAPQAEGENFKWFVGNKRLLEGRTGGGQWLHLPEEERGPGGALQLVDERGRPV